ncbi:MAG TPA: hypothetical protein VLF69_00465 [Candidatus Saccharimonadales bacterium]|nr:hypothetical protein [Candidatus Saccharimonadales bacterium]
MKNINIRSLILYVAIGSVGLFLLLLVTPSITGDAGFMLLSRLFGVLPLLVIAGILALVMGTSKRNTKLVSQHVSKYIGIGAAIGIVFSVLSTYVSTRIPISDLTHNKFVYENIGVGLLFGAYAAALVLMNRQRFVYWPFWNASDKKHADEREKMVRNRVFEKSYRINILLVLVALWLAKIPSQRMHHELYQVAILCLLGLPTIIASWQKDS